MVISAMEKDIAGDCEQECGVMGFLSIVWGREAPLNR